MHAKNFLYIMYYFVKSFLGLIRLPFFELRSFGNNPGGAEHIPLSNKGNNLSICLHFYYVEKVSSNRFYIHSTHTHIKFKNTFILDVINHCPALIKTPIVSLHRFIINA